jgi:hypothetical protein
LLIVDSGFLKFGYGYGYEASFEARLSFFVLDDRLNRNAIRVS